MTGKKVGERERVGRFQNSWHPHTFFPLAAIKKGHNLLKSLTLPVCHTHTKKQTVSLMKKCMTMQRVTLHHLIIDEVERVHLWCVTTAHP